MKYLSILLAALYCIAYSSCTTEGNGTKMDINPNGSSELAILMRDMYDDGMKVKEDVLAGKKAEVNIAYTKIHSADATEPEKVSTDTYKAFAAAYEEAVNGLHASSIENQTPAYNHMVNTCIQCHSEVCPGPIRKIRKMELPK